MFFILKSNKTLRNVFIGSVVVLLAAAAVGLPDFFRNPGPFIIHFSFSKGLIDFLSGRAALLEILLFGFLVCAINYFFADRLYEKERFMSYIFAFAALLASGLILIAVSFISAVN